MKTLTMVLLTAALLSGAVNSAAAQSSAGIAPLVIPVEGQAIAPSGAPASGSVVVLRISIYRTNDDPNPLWVENQIVTLDQAGRYAVVAGASLDAGLPSDLFSDGSARWIGVAIDLEPERPRMMLLSVPYAAKAASADTLAGKTVSDFVLTTNLTEQVKAALASSGEGGTSSDPSINAVTLNFLQKGTGVGTATTDSNMFETGGNVGIGTITPDFPLTVNGEVAATGSNPAFRLVRDGGATFLFIAGSGTAPTQLRNTTNNGLAFWTNNAEQLRIDTAGNVGIGTTSPTAKLHVAGDVTVDGNIAAKYQDVAEWVDSTEPFEPGTVVVIDDSGKNRVTAAARAYDSRVAGAVSAQPGIVLGEPGSGKALVAQSGRVRIKADARNGAIRPGDLLVTSPTKGYAMRSRPLKVGDQLMHRPGTLIGKALEALPTGRGEILVLLTLQ